MSAVLEVILQRHISGVAPVILDKDGNQKYGQEVPERLECIAKGLRLHEGCHITSPDVSDDFLDKGIRQTHTASYLWFLSQACAQLGKEEILFEHTYHSPGIKPDTPIMHGSYELAREGARTSMAAAMKIARGAKYSYALCRPPGHHAGPSWLGGYCYLNNAVIAINTFLESGLRPIGLIDVDFHFGNGSAALLEQNANVFFGSIHSSTEKSYPYIKTEPTNERQIFIPFDAPPNASKFFAGVDRLLEASLHFGCRVLVISIGYDIIEGDPHGGWSLTPSLLEKVGILFSSTSLPLCLIQEGGYLLSVLEVCAYRLCKGLFK